MCTKASATTKFRLREDSLNIRLKMTFTRCRLGIRLNVCKALSLTLTKKDMQSRKICGSGFYITLGKECVKNIFLPTTRKSGIFRLKIFLCNGHGEFPTRLPKTSSNPQSELKQKAMTISCIITIHCGAAIRRYQTRGQKR